MNIFRKIDYLLSQPMLWLRRHLDKRQGELFSRKIADKAKLSSKDIRIAAPFYVKGKEYIQFSGFFQSHPGLRIDCFDYYAGHQYHPHLYLGKNVICNYHCHIGVINEVTIGDNVLMGSRVLITDHQHGQFTEEQRDIPWAERALISKPVHIEDNVWLGENVCVMPGVTIGKGSVIGANAVVTHNIPPYSMAVGVPARVIKSIK